MKNSGLRIFCISFIFLLLTQYCFSQEVYIWGGPGDVNSEFAYGLNDWTTSGGDTTLWLWDANALPDEGTYCGSLDGPILSASAYNGTAIFNSDRYHSVEAFAYPHLGVLTSPLFSTEGHNTVIVRFDQIVRFWHPENVSLLQVSIDGGNSWLPDEGIEVNPQMTGKWNERVDSANMIKLIDITEWAADEPSVQIRFVWDGSYYYWMIDDVYIIEKPEVELGITSTLYDPIAAQVPMTQVDARPSSFGLDVENFGTQDVADAIVGINVTDKEGNILYQDSVSGIELVAGEVSTILFENVFVPTLESYTNTGYHYFNYWVKVPESNEMNPYDNKSRESYYITEDLYDFSYNVDESYSSDIGAYGAFSIFSTGNSKLWNDNINWIADSVRMQIADDNGKDDFVTDIKVFLYKVSNDVASDFSNFDTMALVQFDPNEEAHPQLKLVGFGFESSYLGLDYDDFKIGLYDMEFNECVCLEVNSRYLLMAYWENEERIYHGADKDIFYNVTPSCGWYYADALEGQSHWNFDPWYGWRLSMEINWAGCDCPDDTNIERLPDNSLVIYPNPVDDWLNFEIPLEIELNESTLILYDVNKRIVKYSDLNRLVKNKNRINVNDLAPGAYILKLITKEGVAEKKVIIQR